MTRITNVLKVCIWYLQQNPFHHSTVTCKVTSYYFFLLNIFFFSVLVQDYSYQEKYTCSSHYLSCKPLTMQVFRPLCSPASSVSSSTQFQQPREYFMCAQVQFIPLISPLQFWAEQCPYLWLFSLFQVGRMVLLLNLPSAML